MPLKILLRWTGFFFLSIVAVSAVCFSQEGEVRPERFVQIDELSGEVQVKANAEEGWKIAEKGVKIQQGGEIRTGKDSKAVILIDENGATGKVDVYSNTWMRMGTLVYSEKENQKRTLLDLALGQILVKAEKLEGDGSFQVRTTTSTSSVRGEAATFEVKVEEE